MVCKHSIELSRINVVYGNYRCWSGWGSRRRLFYTGVDTRLKPVVIPTDVIKQSTIIELAPRWVNGNHNAHDWLGRFPSLFRVSRRVCSRLSSVDTVRWFKESRKQAKEAKERKGHHSSVRRTKEYRIRRTINGYDNTRFQKENVAFCCQIIKWIPLTYPPNTEEHAYDDGLSVTVNLCYKE
ncbi:hypothetical protein Q1695_010376 [Nippostrongylus brasiliensis]|nr:hypothetical protein Q1695_010376 [Nippostrongylus brasiliensis]